MFIYMNYETRRTSCFEKENFFFVH